MALTGGWRWYRARKITGRNFAVFLVGGNIVSRFISLLWAKFHVISWDRPSVITSYL